MVERNRGDSMIEGQDAADEGSETSETAAGEGGSKGFVGVPFPPSTRTGASLTALTLLLRCVADLEYNPSTWSNQLRRQSIPGEGPSTRIDCASCDNGLVHRRGIAFPCDLCQGRGWLVVDAYTRRPIGTLETGTILRVKALRCDACAGHGCHGNGRRCEHCNGSGWIEVPVQRLAAVRINLSADASELGPGDPVIAAMERRDKAGDFEQLGLALAALRLELPSAYRTVIRVYVEAALEPDELGAMALLRHDVGLRYLRRLMPDEIRVPSWAARNERRRREHLRKQQHQTKEAAA